MWLDNRCEIESTIEDLKEEEALNFLAQEENEMVAKRLGRVGIVIQARMSSTRLPGKVLKPLPMNCADTDKAPIDNDARPVVRIVYERCQMVNRANVVVLATSTDATDDMLVDYLEDIEAVYTRGSLSNVLERFYNVAVEHKLETIVRITSDCPFVQPELIDSMLLAFAKAECDYMSNVLDRTFPHGLDMEVFSFEALKRAYNETNSDYDREHVTPYLYKYGFFKTENFTAKNPLIKHPELRITLDTAYDYVLISHLFRKFGYDFRIEDIIEYLLDNPELSFINRVDAMP